MMGWPQVLLGFPVVKRQKVFVTLRISSQVVGQVDTIKETGEYKEKKKEEHFILVYNNIFQK